MMKRYSPRLSFFEVLFGIIIGFIAVSFLTREKVAFENLAMGKTTTPYFASIGDHSIHLDQFSKKAVEGIVEGWSKRGKRDVIFVLGNSQTHSINQQKQGDKTYNQLLADAYDQDSLDVITHSIPNANFQEFLLCFNYWDRILPIKQLVVPLFMDDLREDGVREYFFAYLKEDNFKLDNRGELVKRINESLASFKISSAEGGDDADLKGLEFTVQQFSEKWINDNLNERFTTWDNRPTLRGKIFHNLYLLRNTVFGINAQSKRRLIESRLNKNMAALKVLLEGASRNNIQVLAYIPPLRNDVEAPYDRAEYDLVKDRLLSITAGFENSSFINLEDIIPGKYWGVKRSTNLFGDPEFDFMHFQYEGHKLLYEQLADVLKKQSRE